MQQTNPNQGRMHGAAGGGLFYTVTRYTQPRPKITGREIITLESSLALLQLLGLPCHPGSWIPAQTLHTALQPRAPGGHEGWRRCKRSCCHLPEPPATRAACFAVQAAAWDFTSIPVLLCSGWVVRAAGNLLGMLRARTEMSACGNKIGLVISAASISAGTL